MLLQLFWLAPLAVNRAEREITVGHERSHAEVLGKCERLAVVPFGCSALGGIATKRDLAEKPQHPRFVAAFFVEAGETQRALGKRGRFLYSGGEKAGLAQPGDRERMASHQSLGEVLLDRRL